MTFLWQSAVNAPPRRNERSLISERVKDTKRNLRRAGKHQAVGYHVGEANGTGRARELVEDPVEQKAIAVMRKMRAKSPR